MNITPYQLAERWCQLGIHELPENKDDPFILGMLKLDQSWPEHDEVPWCSAFVNFICWQLRLPRSKSLMARSWLNVGIPIPTDEAMIGFDIVILKRKVDDPGPEQTNALGHVGFYTAYNKINDHLYILGGNQNNSITVQSYHRNLLLGIRRIS